MISAQQVRVTPGQTTVQPSQIVTSPYAQVSPMEDIGSLLSSIMPLIMLMMVMMMLMPMMKGMSAGLGGAAE